MKEKDLLKSQYGEKLINNEEFSTAINHDSFPTNDESLLSMSVPKKMLNFDKIKNQPITIKAAEQYRVSTIEEAL